MADAKADANQEVLRGTLPNGTRLRNYELISVLGQGGFGITYYARDTTLGREVAIKEYLPTTLALREATMVVPRSTLLAADFVWGRERFLEEARTLATLEGAPGVVRVYDFLEANGTAYMVMGLARGQTLEERLSREGQLAPAVIERLLWRLLDGLEVVHKTGFLHRDVKPANIILDANNNPTLIDFGASRASMADRTAAMTAIFTPRYAAAEQLTAAKQGPWTDIYGVSATLYHAITGEAPPSSLERALNDTYVPLTRLLPPGFSRDTLHGIDAGLAVRAKERPQSIAKWRAILSGTDESAGDSTVLLKGAPAQPPVPPAMPPRTVPASAATRSGDRRRLALYAGGAAALVVVLLGGYGVYVWTRSPAPAPAREATIAPSAEVAKAQAEAEAEQKAADEARQKAELEARLKAQAEAQQKADSDARQKAAAEAQQKAAAEAQQKMEAEARLKADAEARLKAEREAKQKAEAEAKQKADTEAAAKAAAEAEETALKLSPLDRTRIQLALTALGFDTHGADGVFGPHTREMILAWQQARQQPATGFVTANQQQVLLKEAAPALAKYDEDRRRAEAEARARAATPAATPVAPRPAGSGVSCQDTSGRRIDFPNATSCPYGLTQVR
jgi:serine/threonine protein kinase